MWTLSFLPLTIFAKTHILDISHVSEYTSLGMGTTLGASILVVSYGHINPFVLSALFI